ncbi:MAG: hypothetical protein LBI39_03390 [Puniceicoccales bacterium]|jgi:hypothetical protein|nr:hypothetical protein [Puniceicoccales bacterium]
MSYGVTIKLFGDQVWAQCYGSARAAAAVAEADGNMCEGLADLMRKELRRFPSNCRKSGACIRRVSLGESTFIYAVFHIVRLPRSAIFLLDDFVPTVGEPCQGDS